MDAKGYDLTNKPHLNWAQKLVDLINKYDKKRLTLIMFNN